jgi:hypothetical protein
MNQDDIIRMARDSGMELYGLGRDRTKFVFILERFAALVAEPLQARIKDLYRQLDEAEKKLDQQYKLGAEAKLDECILILERLHERSGGQYNYYLHAAKVLKGEA